MASSRDAQSEPGQAVFRAQGGDSLGGKIVEFLVLFFVLLSLLPMFLSEIGNCSIGRACSTGEGSAAPPEVSTFRLSLNEVKIAGGFSPISTAHTDDSLVFRRLETVVSRVQARQAFGAQSASFLSVPTITGADRTAEIAPSWNDRSFCYHVSDKEPGQSRCSGAASPYPALANGNWAAFGNQSTVTLAGKASMVSSLRWNYIINGIPDGATPVPFPVVAYLIGSALLGLGVVKRNRA